MILEIFQIDYNFLLNSKITFSNSNMQNRWNFHTKWKISNNNKTSSERAGRIFQYFNYSCESFQALNYPVLLKYFAQNFQFYVIQSLITIRTLWWYFAIISSKTIVKRLENCKISEISQSGTTWAWMKVENSRESVKICRKTFETFDSN